MINKRKAIPTSETRMEAPTCRQNQPSNCRPFATQHGCSPWRQSTPTAPAALTSFEGRAMKTVPMAAIQAAGQLFPALQVKERRDGAAQAHAVAFTATKYLLLITQEVVRCDKRIRIKNIYKMIKDQIIVGLNQTHDNKSYNKTKEDIENIKKQEKFSPLMKHIPSKNMKFVVQVSSSSWSSSPSQPSSSSSSGACCILGRKDQSGRDRSPGYGLKSNSKRL